MPVCCINICCCLELFGDEVYFGLFCTSSLLTFWVCFLCWFFFHGWVPGFTQFILRVLLYVLCKHATSFWRRYIDVNNVVTTLKRLRVFTGFSPSLWWWGLAASLRRVVCPYSRFVLQWQVVVFFVVLYSILSSLKNFVRW